MGKIEVSAMPRSSANKIKSEAREKFNIKHPEITCNYQTAFMGKNPQLLFSPEIDLTKISTKKLLR